MAGQHIPLHLKIASSIVALLMAWYLLAILWYVSGVQRGPTHIIGGLAKGLLIPIPMLWIEYRTVFRRHIRTTLFVAIAWFAIALVFAWQLFATDSLPVDASLFIWLISILAITFVPTYIGASHLLWWRTLQAERTPTDAQNAG